MDVIFLNEQLETEYRAKTTDFLWNSKLYEPGEYQIQVLIDADLDLNICRYIIASGYSEIGIIQKWQYDSKDKNVVLISGFFAEHLLYKSIVYPTYSAYNKSIWQITKELGNTYLENLGFTLILPDTSPTDGVIVPESKAITFQQTGDYVGTALYNLAAVYGYGVSCKKEIVNNTECFSVAVLNYHDRTTGNDDEVVFSVDLNNIEEYMVVKDKSNYRNIAIVAGEGEGSARIFETVDISKAGEKKHHLWVDARDLQQEKDETIESYRYKLKQRGLEKLSEFVEIDNIEIEVNQEEAKKFGTDYKLGDIVWVAISNLNLLYKMKIIEKEDVGNGGEISSVFVFGDKIPSQWEKARALFK